MLFKLIKKCYQDATFYKKGDVDFLLEENDWNDYNYYTSYHLHITSRLTKENDPSTIYLGPINIMKVGQKEGEYDIVYKFLGGYKSFERLPEGLYSMSTSIDLFKSLHRYLTPEQRKEFIQAFRLILSANDEYYKRVCEEECFNTSFLRYTSMESLGLQMGRQLLLDQQVQYDLRKQGFTVELKDAHEPLHLDFSPIKQEGNALPNGIIAFIGKNGSGKSTALYQIASLMYNNLTERQRYEKIIGKIVPHDITMSRLIIFSYNPFDNFLLPGENSLSDLRQWSESIKSKRGRFIFCGFRDVENESEKLIQKAEQEERAKEEEGEIVNDYEGHLTEISQKSITELAKESYDAFRDIHNNQNLIDYCHQMMKRSEDRHPEIFEILEDLERLSTLNLEENWVNLFQHLSTGHKFFIHAITHAIAYCEDNSLLMFDEPENHLQWPLLSFLMQELRLILAERSSVMLIATHSPVILQDLSSANIRIVRRNGEKFSFDKPRIETFCESFGEISTEVFDLTSDRVSFFDALKKVYKDNDCKLCDTAQDAVEDIQSILGGISNQAIHYIVQLWMGDNISNN